MSPFPQLAGVPTAPMSDDDIEVLVRWADDHADPIGDIEASIVAPETWARDLPEPVRSFRVEDVGAAEWAMRKLRAVERERTEAREQAAVWKAEVDVWLEAELARSASTAAFFTAHLERYAVQCRIETGRATLTLPSGKVSTTQQKAKVVVEDEAVVIAWAKTVFDPDEHNGYGADAAAAAALASIVKVKESVLLTGLREHVSVSGDAAVCGEWKVPGCTVQPETTTAKVSPHAPTTIS